MNEDVKAKWLDALRSGQYRQGEGFLRVGDSYCCLGVLCDLAVNDGVIPEPTTREEGISASPVYQYGATPNYTVLPDEVITWASVADEAPNVLVPGDDEFDGPFDVSESVTQLNDDGMPFGQIANLIEQHL